jgi:hypothetical protein
MFGMLGWSERGAVDKVRPELTRSRYRLGIKLQPVDHSTDCNHQ